MRVTWPGCFDMECLHYHTETKVLPLDVHMGLITAQYREGALDPKHPMHKELANPEPARKMKGSALDASSVTLMHGCTNENEEEKERIRNKRRLHTAIVEKQLSQTPINSLINSQPPPVHKTETTLPRKTRRMLAQLRAKKCPLLQSYLHAIRAAEDPSCPLCGHPEHNSEHLFDCPSIPTDLTPVDLWRRPVLVADLLDQWQTAIEAAQGDN